MIVARKPLGKLCVDQRFRFSTDEDMAQRAIKQRTAPAPGYGGVAKSMHWLIVALLIAQYAIAWTMPDINPRTPPNTLIDLHFSIGVTILFLAVVRLLWRWRYPVPPVSDNVPAWQDRAARATHALLYLLLFLLPILGWIDAGFRALAINFYEIVTIPPIVAASRTFAGQTGDIHTLASYILLGVIGLHVLATLYHHVWLRDRVFYRMLPGKE
jgi:cytochrome b561